MKIWAILSYFPYFPLISFSNLPDTDAAATAVRMGGMKIDAERIVIKKNSPFRRRTEIKMQRCARVEALGFEPRSAGFHHEGSYPPRN